MKHDNFQRELRGPRVFFLEEMSVIGEWRPVLHRGEAFCVIGAASLGIALNRTVLGKQFRWVDSVAVMLGAKPDDDQSVAARLYADDVATVAFLREQGHLPTP
jgi:hypothetical protein